MTAQLQPTAIINTGSLFLVSKYCSYSSSATTTGQMDQPEGQDNYFCSYDTTIRSLDI